MANEFKVGDVVRLKSDSPKMTVSTIEGDKCWCIWFDGMRKVQDDFKAETLAKYEPSRV
jgi:uncharacterized protein YodC (DUF2158 family)